MPNTAISSVWQTCFVQHCDVSQTGELDLIQSVQIYLVLVSAYRYTGQWTGIGTLAEC